MAGTPRKTEEAHRASARKQPEPRAANSLIRLMGNQLFSCCDPGGRRRNRDGGKVKYNQLQDNGTQTSLTSGGTPPDAAAYPAGVHGGATSRKHPSRSREPPPPEAQGGYSLSEATSGSSASATDEYPPGNRPQREVSLGSPMSNQRRAEDTAGAAGVAVYHDAASNGGDSRKGTAGRGSSGTMHLGANGVAAATAAVGRGSRPAGARPAGQRVVHAHPNDRHFGQPGSSSQAGADGIVRQGGRGVVSYGAGGGGARGGSRFGAAVAAAAAAGVDMGGAPGRGMPRAVPAAPGTVLAKYEIKEVLGIGSTSTCYRCVNRRNKKQFACKVIDKRAMDQKLKPLLAQFHVEIQVLQVLRHPNIIHMEDVFESDMKIHMVMEIMQGGELFDYVVEKGTLSEQEASVMVRKVTSALAYMHSLDIIHRDLKPENLLLTSKGANPEVKIIDFGLAKVLSNEDDDAQSFLGTRGYLAPEMLQRESYNKEVDVWALGVIVFVLLCGCLPFDDDSKKLNRAGAFKKFVLRFPRWSQNLSPGAKGLLSKLLTVTPQARLTAKQALEHPWVTGQVAAADNYLESPRTLRKLRVASPKDAKNRRGSGGAYGGNNAQLTSAKASAADAHRRAEFEEQTDEYRDGGLGLGVTRPRKNSI